MKLYLIRHGHAENPLNNAKRPLSTKGIIQAQQLGQLLKKQNIEILTIGHSDILRAKQTAQFIQKELGPTIELKQVENLRPESDPKVWENNLFLENRNLALVGHMPFMTYFFELLSGDFVQFPTCGLVCLERNQKGVWSFSWKNWN